VVVLAGDGHPLVLAPQGAVVESSGALRARREPVPVAADGLEDEMDLEAELSRRRSDELLVEQIGPQELRMTRRLNGGRVRRSFCKRQRLSHHVVVPEVYGLNSIDGRWSHPLLGHSDS
jgi:hypothetical protein